MLNSLDITGEPHDTKVVVAMSGGVDSSVVAAMLKRQGYDVIGITLQLYDHGTTSHRVGACCAGQDIHDARRVAETLDIPHYVLDYESRFHKEVIEKFALSYVKGETPVPCIDCNNKIKFHDLLATAQTLGADALATGHYVSSRKVGDHRAIYRSLDETRDQSYFLFTATQQQIDFLRFPLGDLTKPAVRSYARELGLGVAEKSDSQDICFVPTGSYADVIKSIYPNAEKPGEIIDSSGRVLGQHQGIIHYTIGQRRGLGISTGERLFVIKIDHVNQKIVVGPRSQLETFLITVRNVNWLGSVPLDDIKDNGLEIYARVRSTRPPVPATIYNNGDNLEVVLDTPDIGVAPGQACVFYDSGDVRAQILGGGWITKTTSASLSC